MTKDYTPPTEGEKIRNSAKVFGIPESTITEIEENGQVKSLVGILYAVARLTGQNKAQMKHWMCTNNLHVDGVPLDLIRTKAGLERVLQYCEAMAQK